MSFKQMLTFPHKVAAIKYGIRNPSLFFTVFRNPSKFYFSKTLENSLNSNLISCLNNLLPEQFLEHWKRKGSADHDGILLLLYALVRAYRPRIVVETGVARGGSSAYILCAMHENCKGHLYSIDLPPYDAYIKKEKGVIHMLEDGQRHSISQKYPIGDLVPEYLKERWTLIYGDARKELPELLTKLEEVTIFYSDSLFTYEHMSFEYATAWPHITKGGLLIAHGVLWSKAFSDFYRKVKSKPLIYYSLGVIKK